ncbi:MAG TPA: VOC family protein, partial [Thermoanaerobaculia bacterium]|nr:VOC family protein [Thermoanaerobaculia bacterium]
MPETSSHDPGSFCWIELGTTDAKAAKAFYGRLFGWTFSDVPAGSGSYTLARRDGLDVSGLYAYDAGQRQRGVPPHWLAYVAVASADEAAARAKALGASELMAPFDAMDAGRMALLADPQGAVFALWQPKSHTGSRLVNETGSYGWVELAPGDDGAATDFYTQPLC